MFRIYASRSDLDDVTLHVENHTGGDACLLVFKHGPLGSGERLVVRADAELDGVLTRFGCWCGLLLTHGVRVGAGVTIDVNASVERASFVYSTVAGEDPRASAVRAIVLAESSSLDALPESDPRGRAARMWWSLDANTHPEMLSTPSRRPLAPWEPTVAEIALRVEAATYLARWLEARSEARRHMEFAASSTIVRAAVREAGDAVRFGGRAIVGERWIAPIAQVLHRAIVAWYPDGGTDGVRFACGAFAAGTLQLERDIRRFAAPARGVALSQGGPDGSTIALFAEFAFAAIDEEIRPTFWLSALPAFIGMLPVFRAAFGAGAPVTPEAWGVVCEVAPRARMDEATIYSLMEETARLGDRVGLERALGRELRALVA
ncbi:MAG: hypothetical protein SGJ09_12525 [Phycisphaerae bacterium]|nr:hypothetical protein [Phycisphaerae bacterium]